jgi:hypothetical protein
MANDIEQIEYAKVTPSERIDLDIEDVQYKPVQDKNKIKLSGKQEVLTPRGEKLEQAKTQVSRAAADAGKTGQSAVSKFMAWNRERKAKAAAPQVQAPVVRERSAPRAPRAPNARRYAAPYQQAQYAPQPQRTTPDIAGGMHQLPNIAGGHGIANTPRIIGNNTSNLPKIVGASRGGSNFMSSIGSGGSTMEKLGHTGGAGNSFEKLGGLPTKGGFMDSLKTKGRGRFF